MASGRTVRLVLCTPGGALLGALPPLPLESPWWPEVGPIVSGVRARHGIDVVVLRLLDGPDRPGEPGLLTYLAEVAEALPPDLPLSAKDLPVLVDEPLRLPWAQPGGVARVVAWADQALRSTGEARNGSPLQMRSWNLSLILRLETTAGSMWCKAVPPFFAHEGAAIGLLSRDEPDLLPPLVAFDRGVVLLRHVPGADQYDGGPPMMMELVRRLVPLQDRWAGRVDELLDAGLPDWRAERLIALVADLAGRAETSESLSGRELRDVRSLVDELPDRFAELAATGLPDTLVHGDLHLGNARSDGRSLVLLDWGDSGVGHPLLDEAALTEGIAPRDDACRVRAAWSAVWRSHRPLSHPERALGLVRPIAALRQAVIYRTFLDAIEPVERRYHRDDVPLWLRRALERRDAEL